MSYQSTYSQQSPQTSQYYSYSYSYPPPSLPQPPPTSPQSPPSPPPSPTPTLHLRPHITYPLLTKILQKSKILPQTLHQQFHQHSTKYRIIKRVQSVAIQSYLVYYLFLQWRKWFKLTVSQHVFGRFAGLFFVGVLASAKADAYSERFYDKYRRIFDENQAKIIQQLNLKQQLQKKQKQRKQKQQKKD